MTRRGPIVIRLANEKVPRNIKIFKTAGASPETIEVRGGFAEVGENGLTILAEHVES